MRIPDSAETTTRSGLIDVFLSPGEFYFGDADTRIRTVLGSCVSITVWHPQRCIGGMCHYMLPSRGRRRTGPPDGRYADEALELFLTEIHRHRTVPAEYVTKVFGGGNMFPNRRSTGPDVGTRNIDEGLRLLADFGFQVRSTHVAGAGHRNVVFELFSGHIWLRHHEPPRGDLRR